MGNGQWAMGNGQWGWGMGNGQWGMGSGRWEVGNGEWALVIGSGGETGERGGRTTGHAHVDLANRGRSCCGGARDLWRCVVVRGLSRQRSRLDRWHSRGRLPAPRECRRAACACDRRACWFREPLRHGRVDPRSGSGLSRGDSGASDAPRAVVVAVQLCSRRHGVRGACGMADSDVGLRANVHVRSIPEAFLAIAHVEHRGRAVHRADNPSIAGIHLERCWVRRNVHCRCMCRCGGSTEARNRPVLAVQVRSGGACK
jgi:hypothetical protein